MKLKIKAAEERKSVAAVIREAAAKIVESEANEQARKRQQDVKKFMKEIKELAKRNAKYTKGFDSTKALREIRYSE